MAVTKNDSYHQIMRNAIADRHGCSPALGGTPEEHCEREHDWVLLTVARSPRVQAGLRRALEILEPHARDTTGSGHSLHLLCRMMLGEEPHDRDTTGYATFAGLANLLAIAAVGDYHPPAATH